MRARPHRVVLVGDSSVGKTSLLACLCGERFDPELPPTVGAGWAEYTREVRGRAVSLEIWDTAGQEAYRALGPLYYRTAAAAALVYDASSRGSFEALPRWAEEFASIAGSESAVFVIANKADLPRAVPDQEGREFAQRQGYEWFLASALTGEGVAEAFAAIAERAAPPLSPAKVAPVPSQKKPCC
jgi:small GTP-binding protein